VAAAVVDRQHLDVDMIESAVDLLVFDPHVGKMQLVIEVRQVVLPRPFLDPC